MSLTGRTLPPTRRVVTAAAVLFVAGLVAWSADLHRWIIHVIELSQPIMARHPAWGALLFVALAGLSAALVFFSSVLLVPFGIQTWGPAGCFVLLWSGWFLGGALTYAIGRRLGWPFVRSVLSPRAVAGYEARIPESRAFLPVLLIQLALPSEAVGYLCGVVRVPVLVYCGALALAELPYALGTVFLGAAFFRRQSLLLVAVAAAGLLLVGWAHWRRRAAAPQPTSRPHR